MLRAMPIMYTVALCAGNVYERSNVRENFLSLKIRRSQNMREQQTWYGWLVGLMKPAWTLRKQYTCCVESMRSFLLC